METVGKQDQIDELYFELVELCNKKGYKNEVTIKAASSLLATAMEQFMECEGCSHIFLSALSSKIMDNCRLEWCECCTKKVSTTKSNSKPST